MQKLNWLNKVALLLNILLFIVSLLGYILPFLAPKLFPILSAFTLALPALLILNVFFFAYWLIQFKNQMLYSGFILLLGITFLNKLYKFNEVKLPPEEKDFKLMSYNVRLFNLYDWIKKEDIDLEISQLIKDQNPDILCIQEFSENNRVNFRIFTDKFVFSRGLNTKLGHGIFSKYPIFNQGVLEFPESDNNACFVDIKKGLDTLRVYSMHLESARITPEIESLNDKINDIDEKRSKKLLKNIATAFKNQQVQAEIIRKHINTCNYKVIVCGDMNNSAFSYVYRTIKGNLNDGFEEAGRGFGSTYQFKYYPTRIDYIFADDRWDVKEFVTFSDFKNSDHLPIMVRLGKKN